MYVDNMEIDGNVKLLLSKEGIKLYYSKNYKVLIIQNESCRRKIIQNKNIYVPIIETIYNVSWPWPLTILWLLSSISGEEGEVEGSLWTDLHSSPDPVSAVLWWLWCAPAPFSQSLSHWQIWNKTRLRLTRTGHLPLSISLHKCNHLFKL